MKRVSLYLFTGILLVVIAGRIFGNRDFRDIKPLKEFALNCKPCENSLSTDKCSLPPTPPDEVINILEQREVDEEYKKWVLLIYLKLYKKQVELYHQSFETREFPYAFLKFQEKFALNNAFQEIVDDTDSYLQKLSGPEFLPASRAMEFIEEKKILQNDPEIQREIKKINEMQRFMIGDD